MENNFYNIIQSEQPVLIDFSAEWCGPCRMMPPILADLKKRMGESIRILKIDVDKNPQISAAYRIQSVPTLAVFKKGEVVWRQSGVMQAGNLETIIKKYI